MKRILLLAATGTALLIACNQKDTKTSGEASHEHHSSHQTSQDAGHQVPGAQRWKTDESTRKHVAELHSKLKAFRLKKDADLASYHILGADLSGELNKLVSDCKMSGPEHEALHGWLAPLLDKVSKLAKARTPGQGQLSVDRIEDSLFQFNQQFE